MNSVAGNLPTASALAATRLRPLLVRFGAMGDMVLVMPLIRMLAQRFDAPVDVLTIGGWIKPLYAHQPGVGRILQLANRKLPFWFNRSKRELVHTLQEQGPRPTWYCDTDDRHLDLLARGSIAAAWVTRSSQLPLQDGEHLIDYWQRLGEQIPPAARQAAEAVGSKAAGHCDPQWVVPTSARAELQAWLHGKGFADRPLVLVQPGNKRTMRRGQRDRASNTKWWPESHWAELIQAIAARQPEAAILLMGVPQEADVNDTILALAKVGTAYNVATELPVSRLLALQAVASSMVSVDTGPAHTAAANGCPLVVLFGVADPVRIRPRGGSTPVRVLTASSDGQPSMRAIAPADVIAAWQDHAKRS